MNTDQTSGAGAYKADRRDTAVVDRDDGADSDRRGFRAPFHLNLTEDREVGLDYRQVAIAAGALGLGYLAFKGVSRLVGKGVQKTAVAAGHTGHLEAVPLAGSTTPDVKDNAAPRFSAESSPNEGSPNRVDDQTPFVAASQEDDTADLVVEVTEIDVVAIRPIGADTSARTAEHVPTDLMGDRPPTADDRAIDAFRPDPTAPVPDGMRESLRPATGPATGFAANRGTFASGLSQTDGSK